MVVDFFLIHLDTFVTLGDLLRVLFLFAFLFSCFMAFWPFWLGFLWMWVSLARDSWRRQDRKRGLWRQRQRRPNRSKGASGWSKVLDRYSTSRGQGISFFSDQARESSGS